MKYIVDLRVAPIVALLCLAAAAQAQFTTVINVPPDVAPYPIDSNTQLNLFAGGVIPRSTIAGSSDGSITNVEVNVFGGMVEEAFHAFSGSTTNVYGGLVDPTFNAQAGSKVNIFGGRVRGLDLNGSTVNITGGIVETARVRDGTVVNVAGGFANFSAGSGSVANVSGGSVPILGSNNGSIVTISGGSIGKATVDGIVNISGGTLGRSFQASATSRIEMFGGDFRLNGNLISGLATVGSSVPYNLASGDVLSATLSDGTPVSFSSWNDDHFAPGVLMLSAAALPPLGPTVITASVDPVPLGIRAGQTLVVDSGASVASHFNAGWGSTVEVQAGGMVGANFEALGAVLNVFGGSVDGATVYAGSEVNVVDGSVGSVLADGGSHVTVSGSSVFFIDVIRGSTLNISGRSVVGGFNAHSGSTVNVSDGSHVNLIRPLSGSTVNIFDGVVGDDLAAEIGSRVHISGGTVGNRLTARSGSSVVLSGGSFGDFVEASPGSALTIRGGEFRINGVPVSVQGPGAVNIPTSGVLSGVLADGTPFAFSSSRREDTIASGALRLLMAGLPSVGPALINAPVDEVPMGIRDGQTLVIGSGGSVDQDFNAGWGSALRIHAGGTVGSNLEVVGGTVDILGGSVGGGLDAFVGTTINVVRGTVGEVFTAHNGSTVNISGGTIGSNFRALAGSKVNLTGREFLLDGTPIAELFVGQPIVLTERMGTLSGRLADGSAFRFPFEIFSRSGSEFLISPDSTLTLTLVPEPISLLHWASCLGLLAHVRRRR
jgi:hypothetical protein